MELPLEVASKATLAALAQVNELLGQSPRAEQFPILRGIESSLMAALGAIVEEQRRRLHSQKEEN